MPPMLCSTTYDPVEDVEEAAVMSALDKYDWNYGSVLDVDSNAEYKAFKMMMSSGVLNMGKQLLEQLSMEPHEFAEVLELVENDSSTRKSMSNRAFKRDNRGWRDSQRSGGGGGGRRNGGRAGPGGDASSGGGDGAGSSDGDSGAAGGAGGNREPGDGGGSTYHQRNRRRKRKHKGRRN